MHWRSNMSTENLRGYNHRWSHPPGARVRLIQRPSNGGTVIEASFRADREWYWVIFDDGTDAHVWEWSLLPEKKRRER
jgi:hypothetical protein